MPELVAVGLDPATVDAIGGLNAPNGDTIDLASLPEGSVVLSQSTADELDAAVGDQLEIFANDSSQTFTVAAIAENSYLSGMRRDNDSGEEITGLAMTLPALQQLSGLDDQITAIALSNAGGVKNGLDNDAAVQSALLPAVEQAGLAINPLKQNWLDDANLIASVFTGLFLVVGLFSISAGILLILLIFTMLAAERRAEMGMARAVGAQRSSLVQQFMSEGTLYALLAGLVGSALGVGVAYAISRAFASVFGTYAHIETSISATSVIAGYCLGVVITFLAVVVSSWRISRLNIVAAVRDLPDASHRNRSWKTFLWQGLLVAGGVLLTMQGISSGSAMPFTTGVSLLVLSIALILRQVGLSSRKVFNAAGIFLLDLLAAAQRSLCPHLRGVRRRLRDVLRLGHLPGDLGHAGHHAERPHAAGPGLAPRFGLPIARRGAQAGGCLSGRRPQPHRHDHRHVQPDRLLAGHDRHHQSQFRARLPGRLRQRRMGYRSRGRQ